MYTREFTPMSATARLQEHLVSQMDGSPIGGFYPAKIGFGIELLLQKPPTIVRRIEKVARSNGKIPHSKESNLLPRAFNVFAGKSSPNERYILKAEDASVMSLMLALKEDEGRSCAVRDMDADRLWYVHSGSGVCYTDLGSLQYAAGDLVYIPSHVLAKFVAVMANTKMVGIASKRGLRLPSRRAVDNDDTPFSDFAVRLPEPYDLNDEPNEDENLTFVKRGDEWSIVEYKFSPFMCVAWKGTPYPFAIDTRKLNFPYVQSIHPDPSNFAVLMAPDKSVVASVLGPRFVHSLPYSHSNIWDEFLFYAKKYDARKGSGGGVGDAGTATMHPQGIWHGPQIAAFEAWKRPASPKEIPWVEDLAIMFETRSPLEVCTEAQDILIPGYENSWLEGWQEYEERQNKK